jgi:hypothetical protein
MTHQRDTAIALMAVLVDLFMSPFGTLNSAAPSS